jgi:hypothetical protein
LYPEAEFWQVVKLALVTKLGRESGSMTKAMATFGCFLIVATIASRH